MVILMHLYISYLYKFDLIDKNNFLIFQIYFPHDNIVKFSSLKYFHLWDWRRIWNNNMQFNMVVFFI